jgi:hypothetical protein
MELLRGPLEVAKCDLKQFGGSMRVAQMVLLKPIEPRVLILRGTRVILDSELAELYGVQVKRLNGRSSEMPSASLRTSCSSSLPARIRT